MALAADAADSELLESTAPVSVADVDPVAAAEDDEDFDPPEPELSLVDEAVVEPLSFAPDVEPSAIAGDVDPLVVSVLVRMFAFVAVVESLEFLAADRLVVPSLTPAFAPSVPGSVGFVPPSVVSFVGGFVGVDVELRDPPPPPPPAPAPPPDRFGFSHGFWRAPPDPPLPGFWFPECLSTPRSRVEASTIALISLRRRRAALRVGASSLGADSPSDP